MFPFSGRSGPGAALLLLPLLTSLVLPVAEAGSFSGRYGDSFDEELLLKPLQSGHLFAHFHFTTRWDADAHDAGDALDHFHLFPRTLGEVAEHFKVRELHLSLTQGLWRHQKWGYPVVDAAPGAELWVWFKKGAKNVTETWNDLTNALSGLFCASLNFIDAANSVSPELSFRPSGVTGSPSDEDASLVRYATLPRETVCTENLTPWKKLLPCDTRRGLATLLNARHIYTANYHSLGVHLRPICRDRKCLESSLELTQTVSLVFDILAYNQGNRDWSTRKVFGSALPSACPLAQSSKIFVTTITDGTTHPFTLNPPPMETITSHRGGTRNEYASYDVASLLSQGGMLNVAASYSPPSTHVHGLLPLPVLTASSFVSGSGLWGGRLVVDIGNNYRQRSIRVAVLQVLPWFLRTYLHTLSVKTRDRDNPPVLVRYGPSLDRLRPTRLELVLDLPPQSYTRVSLDFHRGFLKWLEYPPDANHGFYVPPAVVSAELPGARNFTGLPQDGSTIAECFNASRSSYFVRLRTEPLLVSLPTPDFSMPYNVICLTCTVVALAFGPLHNITTKSLVLRDASRKRNVVVQATTWIKQRFLGKKDEKADVTAEKKEQEKKQL